MSKVAIAGNASGTGTFTIAAPNSNTDRTLTLPDEAGTVLTSASTVIQNGGPSFAAYLSSDQVTSNDVSTKIQINTEWFDTDNCYDTSNYRFTPNVAGYYQVNTIVRASADASFLSFSTFLYKNGSYFIRLSEYNFNMGFSNQHATASVLVYLNGSTDYIELYGLTYSSGGTGNTFRATPSAGTGQNTCQFSAYLVRAA